jgi:cell wall-associated NlpC family hydrolase
MQRRHLGAVLLPLLAILLIGALAPAVAQAATAAQKRAQAKAVKAQIDALDVRLEMAIEQYNLASDKLSEVQARVADNKLRLDIAGNQLKLSRETLAQRAEAIYKQHSVDMLDVILATQSFDELISSLDLMERLSQNDSTIVNSVEKLKKEIKQRRVALLADQKKAQQIVAQRVAMRTQVEGQLAERQTMLKGVEKQIAKLERQEAERARRAAQAAAAQQNLAAPGIGGGDGIHTTLGAHPSVVDVAKAQLGDPYVWAAAGPDAFDCSGLAMYCYSVATGIGLPHNAAQQYAAITHIARDSAQPGDLVFFGSSASSIHHVGIYIDGGQMIHAPHTGDVVSYESVDYSGDLYGFGRP